MDAIIAFHGEKADGIERELLKAGVKFRPTKLDKLTKGAPLLPAVADLPVIRMNRVPGTTRLNLRRREGG